MRRASIGGGLGVLAAMAMAAATAGGEVEALRKEPDPKPKRARRIAPTGRRYRNAPWLPASVNRHTGKPHEHKAEIARRARQEARVEENRQARGGSGLLGFSRSRLTLYADGNSWRGKRADV